MEAAPPSYEKATLVDPWDIIARYIPSNDLCSAALVCSRWHSTFTPHLWGNPASHFGIENDRVYVALTKFKRTLRTARLLVRSLTHTLHLPPAHAEIYNGPNSDWLRDSLDRLPNLQSLIVQGLPFFDHSALQALKYERPNDNAGDESSAGAFELPGSAGFAFQRPIDFIPSFGLRLLDASRCSNVTSSSLAQALSRLEDLLYLDLSFTYPARDPVVLQTLRRFSGLQVLKLRGVSLYDEALTVLASAIGRRVRSLDIRNNNIGDKGVRTLLDECFIDSGAGAGQQNGQRSPALLSYMGREMLDIYQGKDFESFIRNAFTGRFVGRLAIEDAPVSGITHLYIAGNNVSAEGLSGLVRSGRLHVFDAQTPVGDLGRQRSISFYGEHPSLPGVEKLTSVLSKYGSEAMTFLRIDHSLITKDAPNLHGDETVSGRYELADTALPDLPRDVPELDATSTRPEAMELPTVQTPKYELPGDPLQFVVSPATNDAQHRTEDEVSPMNFPRRGSAFAPEAVETLSPGIDHMSLLSPISALDEGRSSNGLSMTPVSPSTPNTPPPDFGSESPSPRPRSYSSIAGQRRARLNAHLAEKNNLHPAMLPHLSTLVLTDVPSHSSTKDISDRIICFIRQCAEEASFARTQAKSDYALPPGRKGHLAAIKHSADKIFGLKLLVLEVTSVSPILRSSKASPWHHESTKSMTEDRDSESLWSAAETDFSFFGEEDSSFPSLESGRYAYSSRPSEKEVNYNGSQPSRNGAKQPQVLLQPRFDTIALVSAFRKERKLAHQRNIAAGAIEPDTEGYWDGVIQVKRPGSGETDESDYYGNRFENGYLYR